MAPDTIVVAVVAKESWNRKVVNTGPAVSGSELSEVTNQDPKAMKGLVQEPAVHILSWLQVYGGKYYFQVYRYLR